MRLSVSIVSTFLTVVMVRVHANSTFSQEEQAIWIDRFNYFRTTGLPWSAGNMCRIGWSPDLATTAASTATKCSATTRPGLNVYNATSITLLSLIDEAIQQWVVETSMRTLKTLTQPSCAGVEVGKGTYNSYSQVLWAHTTSVGCASADCSGGQMVVCEFSPAGNDGSSAWYVHANTASDCPSGTKPSQGLCIVEGDTANDLIAPIPAGKLTYEVYPAYVANMQTVLIETARGIANGETKTASANPRSTATSTAVKALPTSFTSNASLSNLTETDIVTKITKPEKASSSSSTMDYVSSSLKTSLPLTKIRKNATLTSTKTENTTISSSFTDPYPKSLPNEKSQTSTSLLDGDTGPGTVTTSSDSGSTFMNQEASAKQTPSNSGSPPSVDNDDKRTIASTPTPDSDTANSINNQTSKAVGSRISPAGMAGISMLTVVAVAFIGVVVSYKRNQRRQHEIMRDGGIQSM